MPVDGDFGDEPSEPIDRLVIALRAFVRRAPKKAEDGLEARQEPRCLNSSIGSSQLPRMTPSDWVLVFDCETRTTPDQRLRFGAYQLRYKGQVWERGASMSPMFSATMSSLSFANVIADEEATSDGERVCLRTRAEFVDEIFYRSAYAVGAQIVGFNLPFDLSRLAIRHASARRAHEGRL